MGTRAQFFIGNPQDVENRKWLGCTAWDGYPDGWVNLLQHATSEADFVRLVGDLTSERDDFCDPQKHGFPFPWVNDLFLTDYTYAWFNGKVMMTGYHTGWIEMREFMRTDNEEGRSSYYEQEDELPRDVPAPSGTWDQSAPDSIMIVAVPR